MNSLFSLLLLKLCDPYGCVLNSVFFWLYTLAWEEGRILISFLFYCKVISLQLIKINGKKKMILFIDFLAVLGLPCCVDFSVVVVQGLLIMGASPLVEQRLQGAQASAVVAHGLSCSSACRNPPDLGSNPLFLWILYHWAATEAPCPPHFYPNLPLNLLRLDKQLGYLACLQLENLAVLPVEGVQCGIHLVFCKWLMFGFPCVPW